jgi:MFS family permease
VLLATVLVVRRRLVADDPALPNHGGPDHTGPSRAGVADGPTSTGARTSRRRRWSPVVAMMAASAFAAALLEVTPNDWAAVLMRDVFHAGRASGFGSVAVAGAMLVGRLGGDHVMDRVGAARLLAGALVLVAAGAAITVAAPATAVALAGLAMWGLGLSVVFPQLYAAAARLPGTSAGAGLGSMLLGQRLGGLVTAVAVGGLAEWWDLRVAFAVMSCVAFAILAMAGRDLVRPRLDQRG